MAKYADREIEWYYGVPYVKCVKCGYEIVDQGEDDQMCTFCHFLGDDRSEEN